MFGEVVHCKAPFSILVWWGCLVVKYRFGIWIGTLEGPFVFVVANRKFVVVCACRVAGGDVFFVYSSACCSVHSYLPCILHHGKCNRKVGRRTLPPGFQAVI